MLLSNQRTFIHEVAIIINLITMNTLEPKGTVQNIPKSTLPHFKSSNYLQTNNNMRPSNHKIRRDRSAMSNFYAATPEKHATIDMNNKFSSKSLLETNLPEISTKHRSQKKSGFLEMWLDQALDPQQITGTTTATLATESKAETQRAGPLKTVQKFEIDKKYLRSQNIANETIDKLYNSLYVYTYGINNTFEEIMSLTKSNEHAQKKIINNFWKAFIKLLQGCTSYRTVFQVVEESHLKTIVDLKQTFMRKEAEFYRIQSMHEEELAKLNKRINEQSYTISKVMADYNISEATLQLTDQAFNDQVNLRLKFQQKVNAMFNSYEEIRVKYQKLLTDLRMKGEEQLQIRKTEVMLRAQVEQSTIRIEDLQKRLARSKEIIKEREEENEIKRHELYEMTGKYTTLVDAKDESQEQVRKIISKSHAYKLKNQQLQCEIKIQKNHSKELEQRIKKQQNIINVCRDANEKIYDKYELCGKEVGTFEGIRFELEAKITQLKEDLAIKQDRNAIVEAENRQLSDRKVELQQQLQLTKGDLQIKINCIEKNTEVISDLRAVKDKLEKLYNITAFEKKNMEITMNEAVRISEIFSEEMKGMKMLLESKTVQLDEANHKLQNQRQVFRAKINSLKEEIQAKQSQILNLHDKQLADQQFVQKASQERQKFAKSNQQLTGDKIQLSSQNLQLKSKVEELEHERIDNRAIMQKLNDTIEQLQTVTKKNEAIMSNKEFLIQNGKLKKDSENKQLRQMLESYREDRQRKVSFIHPMIYEDCREQIDRLTHKVERLIQQKLENEEKIVEFEATLGQKEEIITKLDQNLNEANQNIETKIILIEQLTKKIKEFEHRLDRELKERLDKEGKTKNMQLQYEKEIQTQKDTIRSLKDQSHYDKSLIKKHNQTLSNQIETIKTLTATLKKTENDLIHQNQQAAKLREQLSSQPRKTETKSVKTPAIKSRRLTSNQQDRSSISTPKEESVRDESHRDRSDQGVRLGPIKEELARQDELNKTANNNDFKKQKKLMIDQSVQTQKPKFSHNSKFETVSPSYSCQVNLTSEQSQQYLHQQSPQRSPREAERQPRRIQGNEFKRALKLTYMRR